jgi:hypothetical protein
MSGECRKIASAFQSKEKKGVAEYPMSVRERQPVTQKLPSVTQTFKHSVAAVQQLTCIKRGDMTRLFSMEEFGVLLEHVY